MATEKRLISVDAVLTGIATFKECYEGAGLKPWIVEQIQTALQMVERFVKESPTVDAVEVDDMREFAEDVVYQFGYYCQKGGRLHITHGGLSTLECAFDILGWENPHPVPECECEIEGCHEHATCGTPTADGYKRVCGRHFAKMDGDGNG